MNSYKPTTDREDKPTTKNEDNSIPKSHRRRRRCRRCCCLPPTKTASSSFLEAAQRRIESEFQPSTLTKQEQMDELTWFIEASAPYRGMAVRVLSEIIDTHQYESTVLAQAFADITGINVVHDTRHEGDVVNTLLEQFETGNNLYDGYISDSDLIGTHFRHDYVYPLSDYIDGEGQNVTLPTLDLPDFIGTGFTTAPDGKLYQLPDQQFANL